MLWKDWFGLEMDAEGMIRLNRLARSGAITICTLSFIPFSS